jgi:hypothetical protein
MKYSLLRRLVQRINLQFIVTELYVYRNLRILDIQQMTVWSGISGNDITRGVPDFFCFSGISPVF